MQNVPRQVLIPRGNDAARCPVFFKNKVSKKFWPLYKQLSFDLKNEPGLQAFYWKKNFNQLSIIRIERNKQPNGKS